MQTRSRRGLQNNKANEEDGEAEAREDSVAVHETQDPEWAIREGTDPIPAWAKRDASGDTNSDPSERKRQKVGDAAFRTFVLAPANEGPSGVPQFSTGTEFAADFGQQAQMDPVEQEIQAIARDQRFLPEEVRAYFQRNNDLLVTRQRFERVRALIDNLP